MRIISGIRRGKKLLGFEGDDIRPTTDRVKESIFNIIAPYVPSAAVLDLFGGTGALAMEALSRGAESAVITDNSDASLDIIRRNAKMLDFEKSCTIIKSEALSYLDGCKCQFDVILLDPPYNKGFIEPVLEKISQKGILADGGIIMLESDSSDMHDEIQGLAIDRQRKYGRTYITIYKKQSD